MTESELVKEYIETWIGYEIDNFGGWLGMYRNMNDPATWCELREELRDYSFRLKELAITFNGFVRDIDSKGDTDGKG